MRLTGLCALALAAESAYGYLDSQPFFMFSTSELLTTTSKIQTAHTIVSEISFSLSQCPSDYYIFVEQQGVSAHDYKSRKATPALAQRLSNTPTTGIKSNIAITDVLGAIKSSKWIELLESTCGVTTTEIDAAAGEFPTTFTPAPRLIKVKLPAPSSKSRDEDMGKNDAFFASILDMLPSEDYTVLYTTTRARDGWFSAAQHEATTYEMESAIQENLHLDLKRDLGDLAESTQTENQTLIDGPLFDRYQFFTPGIFMGFITGFILLMILYVAVSAVASLQVTYAAFDKETGALAGKKTQ